MSLRDKMDAVVTDRVSADLAKVGYIDATDGNFHIGDAILNMDALVDRILEVIRENAA